MNWVRHSVSTTFETKSSYCRVVRQGLPSVAVLEGSSTTWFQTSRYCRAKVEFNSINCVRRGSSTTFETGLTWIRYPKLSTAEIVCVQSQLVKNNEILVYQSGISLNLRTGPTGHATLFNQWEGALVFIKIQIKTSTCWSKISTTLKTHTTMTTLTTPTTLINNPYNPDYRHNPWLD